MQARWGRHGDHEIVALCPSSVAETYTLAIEAFNLAEELRSPVILLMDEIVGHLRERVELPATGSFKVTDRAEPTKAPGQYKPYEYDPNDPKVVPPLAPFGHGYRFHVTGLSHAEDGFPTNSVEVARKQIERINKKISLRSKELGKVEELFMDDAEIYVFAYGGTARSARKAVKEARAQGIKAALIRDITLWPFNDHALLQIKGRSPKAIIVPEMNMGQMVLPVQRVIGDACPVIPLNRVGGGFIEPDEILDAIKEVK